MYKDTELVKNWLKKKNMEMKNEGTYSQGNAVKSPSDEEDVKDKLDAKKSDLAPETEESKSMEKGLLAEHETSESPEKELMESELFGEGEETLEQEETEEEVLGKLYDESQVGRPGINGKVAALMKSKMRGK